MTMQLKQLTAALRAAAATGGLAAVHVTADARPPDAAPLPAATLNLSRWHRPAPGDFLDGLARAEFDLTIWRRDGSTAANAAGLAELADGVVAALLADPSQGGLALPGPGGAATEILAVAPGRDQAPPMGSMLVRAACWLLPPDGLTPQAQADRVTIDGESPLASGPHVLAVGGWRRRRVDRNFAGLDGTVSVELGASVRPMRLVGRLVGDGGADLLVQVADLESLARGTLHTLTAPDGRVFADVRVSEIEWGRVLTPAADGAAACVGYRMTLEQLGA
ncbi:MAG: hypothetical protein BIFFINMI_02920 [Phycisphaerae bacterium]|nr:hypothetical protein [Phycisphaerae bacterium]